MTQPAASGQPLSLVQVAATPPYAITIGPGAARRLPGWLASRALGARYAIVTDSNVARLHAAALREAMAREGLVVETIVFAAGEESKTRETKEAVEDAMIAAGLGRDAAVVALGGGVVGDLAGFVAATYMRGVPLVQAPTTLLAMVDASIGGKTAVDHPLGKNLIGAFHQPAAVFIDTDYLFTLPDREYRSGLAEVVKAAVIREAALLDRLAARPDLVAARDRDLLSEAIAAACRIKAAVVGADERESDLRKILNFGHTIGHAIEALSGYRMSHGEAVSIGMVAEARIAERAGIAAPGTADRIEAALDALGLPVRLPAGGGMTTRAVLEAARRDKKARGGRTAYALPCRVGDMARGADGFGIAVDDAVATSVLDGMQGTAGGS